MENKLYTDLSNDDYHADKNSVSSSLVKKMAQSYSHAKYAKDNPSVSTASMELGTVFHNLVLEPDDIQFLIMPEDINLRTKDGKAQKAEMELTGKLIIKQEVYDAAKLMTKSALSHPVASKLLTDGIAEQSIFWTENGLQRRCRPDYYKDNNIIDLKSAIDASPSGFAKAIANFGYDIQQAFYEDGVNTQMDVQEFYFVVTENKPPYLTGVYQIKYEHIARARLKYQDLLAGWQSCLEFDYYPGYSNEIVMLDLPKWHK